MQVLQDHAAKTVLLASSHPTCVASQGNYDQIWETIYSNINLYQVQQEEITNMPFCSTHHLFVALEIYFGGFLEILPQKRNIKRYNTLCSCYQGLYSVDKYQCRAAHSSAEY